MVNKKVVYGLVLSVGMLGCSYDLADSKNDCLDQIRSTKGTAKFYNVPAVDEYIDSRSWCKHEDIKKNNLDTRFLSHLVLIKAQEYCYDLSRDAIKLIDDDHFKLLIFYKQKFCYDSSSDVGEIMLDARNLHEFINELEPKNEDSMP